MVVCLTDVSEILYALNTSPVTKDIQSTALNLILVNLASCDKIFSQVLTTGQWHFANSYQICFFFFFLFIYSNTEFTFESIFCISDTIITVATWTNFQIFLSTYCLRFYQEVMMRAVLITACSHF